MNSPTKESFLKPNEKVTTSLKAITYTGINRVKNVTPDGTIEAV